MNEVFDRKRFGELARAALVLTVAIGLTSSLALAKDKGADGQFSKRTSPHFVLYQDVGCVKVGADIEGYCDLAGSIA